MSALKNGFVFVGFVAVAVAAIYEAHRASRLKTEIQTVQRQQASLVQQVDQLQQQGDDIRKILEALMAQNEHVNINGYGAELLRLRGEVASLRARERELTQSSPSNDDPAESAAKDLVGKINLIRQRLEQMPEKNIPELKYLDNAAWARVAQGASLDTDAGVREAFASLRNLAKQAFAPQMAEALQAYAQANEGRLPSDPSLLKPYFESGVDDGILARYRMIGSGDASDLQPGQMIVSEKAAADNEHDYLFQIGLNSRKSEGVGQNGNVVEVVAWSPRAVPTPGRAKGLEPPQP